MVGSDKKLEAEGTHIKIIIQSYWCNWIIPVALSLSRRGKHSYEICPPPHIITWAITLTLIGHSELDEDKCLGQGWESITPTGFRSISERKEIFINAMLDVTGLESLIISQTFCTWDHTNCHFTSLLHTNTCGTWLQRSSLCIWKRCETQEAPRETETLVTYSSGPRYGSVPADHLGSRFAYSCLSVIVNFPESHPHLLSLNGGQVSRQMANRQWASIPWGSPS